MSKRHKIWEKLYCLPKFFWAGTAIVSNNVFFFIFINLLWGSVNNGQSLHELHNNKSLRTPALEDAFGSLNIAIEEHFNLVTKGPVICINEKSLHDFYLDLPRKHRVIGRVLFQYSTVSVVSVSEKDKQTLLDQYSFRIVFLYKLV